MHNMTAMHNLGSTARLKISTDTNLLVMLVTIAGTAGEHEGKSSCYGLQPDMQIVSVLSHQVL